MGDQVRGSVGSDASPPADAARVQDLPMTWVDAGDLSLMGIPTWISADQGPLLRAALAAYADWASPAEASAEISIALRLEANSSEAASDEPCAVRVDGGVLRLDGPGIRGEADAARREAWCTVPATLAADPGRLAAEVLDTLLLFLLTRSGRIPLHAAGIVIGDTAILLAGPSGSGKSTLALTADRAGLPVLSEDSVYLQLEPHFGVWGSPRPIHLLPQDLPPEGDRGAGLRHRNGRWKVALPLRGGSHRGAVGRAVLCLLERGEALSLSPHDRARAVERVMSSLDPGFDHFRAELPAALQAVTAGGAFTLTLPSEPLHRNPDGPRAAIALLRERFGG